MITLKATTLAAYDLSTADGKPLGVFTVESYWHDMRRLVSLNDPADSVIVDGHGGELRVVKASPEMIAKLRG